MVGSEEFLVLLEGSVVRLDNQNNFHFVGSVTVNKDEEDEEEEMISSTLGRSGNLRVWSPGFHEKVEGFG